MAPQQQTTIVAIDDDPGVLNELAEILIEEEWHPRVFTTGRVALEYFEDHSADCVILDIHIDDQRSGQQDEDGLEILEVIKKTRPLVPVIMLTGRGFNVANAVRATRMGAMNFLEKPINRMLMVQTIRSALENSWLRQESAELRKISLAGRGIMGHSEMMRRVFYRVERFLESRHPILIMGAPGTGKSQLAEAMHYLSSRRQQPYYAIDCNHFQNELFVSEMFGHVKGAFTGAISDKPGKVEMSAGGTLFIDEIQALSLENQGRLKQFIQEGVFTPLGGISPKKVDTRVIVATNQDINSLVRKNQFLEDLHDRLNVLPIHLPSLSERREDIPEIATSILKKEALLEKRPFTGFTEPAIHYLQALTYEGNVRSLQGIIQRAITLAEWSPENQLIDENHIFQAASMDGDPPSVDQQTHSYKSQVDQFKRNLVEKTLLDNQMNRTESARVLGLSPANLSHKIRRFGINLLDMEARHAAREVLNLTTRDSD